jgi:hypothetical protein
MWEWDSAYQIYKQVNGIKEKERVDFKKAKEIVRDYGQW